MQSIRVLYPNCNKTKHIITPSVKLRIGTSPENIEIEDYLKIIKSAGISKVYIHARTLKYSYYNPARYELLEGLKGKFKEMELILNGDVDSYNSYQDITERCDCAGIMIGRAALTNPLIFTQIKKKVKAREGKYDPLLKDPNIIRAGHTALAEEKINVIKDFIEIAISADGSPELVKRNLNYLLKGIKGAKSFLKEINLNNKISNKEIFKAFDLAFDKTSH